MINSLTTGSLEQAYEFCREVARREAKNFYYAFRVLPKEKRDAMCAVYAFMRRADDISDDESKTLVQRRVEMQTWLEEWRAARYSGVSPDPVFCALADTQARFAISDDLLEDLVRGTSMDLIDPGTGADGHAIDLGDGLMGYRTFDDLYRYCYLVASVVGLVCIRVFGYSDPAAEVLAEKTGIAFQLTNILRDVKEDAFRGRIYLPQDLLAEFGVNNADVLAMAAGNRLRPNDCAMIGALSVQAWEYYESAWQLLPLIDRNSRAALWVMVEIYSGLLTRIDRRQGDIFSKRVSLPTAVKLVTLARGTAKALRVGGR